MYQEMQDRRRSVGGRVVNTVANVPAKIAVVAFLAILAWTAIAPAYSGYTTSDGRTCVVRTTFFVLHETTCK